jgi:hemerythrin-like domain-containing protein
LIDLEIIFIKNFNWSLRDIDETDVESMIDFINRFGNQGAPKVRKVFCDQIDF